MQGSQIAVLMLELLISWFEPLAAVQPNSGGYPLKCRLPITTGACKASFAHFYFDVRTKKCEVFIYGGCGGNANNFKDPVDCIWECERFDWVPAKCKLPLNRGVWGGIPSRRYFYDFRKRKCALFFYYGAKGNKNNFLTIKQCTGECAVAVYRSQKCRLPVAKGPCKGYQRRFYYNIYTKRCELFIYSGCKGNGNNFTEMIDCIRECQSYAPREDRIQRSI